MDILKKTFRKAAAEKRLVFCAGEVLGHPNPKEFLNRVKEFLKAKPDMLEFSIPFSDPIADGKVIETAHTQALKSGVTPRVALRLIAKIRRLTDVPIFLIVYSNLILKRGIAKFYRDLKRAGADSILVPDVPLEEIRPFAMAAKSYRIHQILLVSENTITSRLREIQKISRGFLYVVSTLGVTGARKKLNKNIASLIKKLKTQSKIPLMIGFGISQSEHTQDIKKAHADAVVVCSAFVKTETKKLAKFASELKKACGEIRTLKRSGMQ